MQIRKATVDDINTLIQLRIDYIWFDWKTLSAEDESAIREQLASYIPRRLNNEFVAILAEEDDRVVSAAFLAVSEKPANPVFINGKVGTLLNVLTYPEYRRRGYAYQVVSRMIEEAKALGLSMIELSATPDGKPLYEKLGFGLSTSEAMRMVL